MAAASEGVSSGPSLRLIEQLETPLIQKVND